MAALVATFLAAFWWQRQRSTFLAIERDRARAEAIAAQHALTLAEAMALRDLVGADAPESTWNAAAAQFRVERARLGDALAAVAIAGERAAAEGALRPGVDPALAWREFRLDPRALPGLRFLALRERFAARGQARD